MYSRYVDDLVFSSDTYPYFMRRKEFRRFIEEAGFRVNHRKSFILGKEKGVVFITSVGIGKRHGEAVFVFPKWKRCRLEGLIKSYLVEPFQKDTPEIITGVAAEFLYYYTLAYPLPEDKKTPKIKPTKSDERTMRLCKQFEAKAAPYLGQLRYERERKQEEREEKQREKKNLRQILNKGTSLSTA